MRPVAFDYYRAETVDHALELLGQLGDEARPLAGGYSLVPMMNLRLARPQHLIDINALELGAIEEKGGIVRLGGLVRHVQLISDPVIAARLPLFKEAARHLAHPTIRNRGSLGGSLAHADPTAELSLMAVLHDAAIVARSPAGERRIAASEFFQGAFTTALAANELLVALEVPVPGTDGSAFLELSERHGDFAIVAVGVIIRVADGRIGEARIACAGAGSVPVRGGEAESHLVGRPVDATDAEEAGRLLAETQRPSSDIRASAEYRKHLIVELTRRAVEEAVRQAKEAR